MITKKILAKKNNENTTFLLQRILNDGNEVYQFKINDEIFWYFRAKYETEQGFYIEDPPFGISEGKYMIALEILMNIFKVA